MVSPVDPHAGYAVMTRDDPSIAFFGASRVSKRMVTSLFMSAGGSKATVFSHPDSTYSVALEARGFKIVFGDRVGLKGFYESEVFQTLCERQHGNMIDVARFVRTGVREDLQCKFGQLATNAQATILPGIKKSGLITHALDASTNSTEAHSLFVPATIAPEKLSRSQDPWVRQITASKENELMSFAVPAELLWVVVYTFLTEGEALVFADDISTYGKKVDSNPARRRHN